MIGDPNSVVIKGTMKSNLTHGLPHEVLSSSEINARFPVFRPTENEIGILEADAGVLVPELCVEAHLNVAETHGAILHFNEAMTSWEHSLDSKISIKTSLGSYTCDKVVFAVGVWAPEIFRDTIPMSLHVERRVLYWFEPEGIENFDDIPVYIWDMENGVNFYGFPRQGAEASVKVAMHGADKSTALKMSCTPATVDRSEHADETEQLRQLLRAKIPTLDARLAETVTCMYTLTKDQHFVLDFHPNHPNALIVSACSGHGFKFCSVIGEIAAELTTTGRTRHDISLFRMDPERDLGVGAADT